jgi:hypothetical protein
MARETAQFPYLSVVTDLPPLVAQAAFDAILADGARHIELKAGRLELRGNGLVPSASRAAWLPYRELPGLIRPARWRLGILVRLELWPWSDTRTALGFGLRHLPLFAGEAHYLPMGIEALEVLAVRLEDRALQEVNAVEQWLETLCHADPAAP